MSSENDEYATSGGADKAESVPVTKDEDVQDPQDAALDEEADSDAQLQKDEEEAIDKSNIIDERTRGAPASGTYTEPGDDEGIPVDEK